MEITLTKTAKRIVTASLLSMLFIGAASFNQISESEKSISEIKSLASVKVLKLNKTRYERNGSMLVRYK